MKKKKKKKKGKKKKKRKKKAKKCDGNCSPGLRNLKMQITHPINTATKNHSVNNRKRKPITTKKSAALRRFDTANRPGGISCNGCFLFTAI
jgi:hypothetical protein